MSERICYYNKKIILKYTVPSNNFFWYASQQLKMDTDGQIFDLQNDNQPANLWHQQIGLL